MNGKVSRIIRLPLENSFFEAVILIQELRERLRPITFAVETTHVQRDSFNAS